MKTIMIRLTDETGNIYKWTVRHLVATNLTLGQKPKKIAGWSFTDHEGYERFAEGNWMDLVAKFRLVAENYGLTSNIS